jgi:hypothetical protein
MSHPPTQSPGLFAIMLGGRAPGCHIELHDVVFAVGNSFEALMPDLRRRWFGDPDQCHADAWVRLDGVDGHRIELGREPASQDLRLWFINIGGYADGEFAEQHAYGFIAAASKTEAKQQARASLLPGRREWHKDDLFDIDDCLKIDRVDGWHIHLLPDSAATCPRVHNGYFPLPKAARKAGA